MKKALSVLLCLCLSLSVFTALPFSATAAETRQETAGAASGTTGDCTWSLDDDGVLTISGNGAMRSYESDRVYVSGSYYYKTIAPWGYNITSVIIQDGVTSIGNSAFEGCTGLTSVTIGNGVTSIGGRAFYGCTGLTNISVNDNNTVYDSRNNCNAIICTANNELVFGCQNTVIPDSVTSIGNYAFSGCKGLTSVTIGNSVTSIGNSAFEGCTGLTSVFITDLAAWCEIDFHDTDSNPLIYAHNLYLNNELVTDPIIPDSVTSIGNYALSYCTGLTSVTIPDSVTSIGNSAFYGCTDLISITIPDSVTNIGEDAFTNTRVSGGMTDNCVWWCSNGVLTISGNGAMSNYEYKQVYVSGSYDYKTTAPWGYNITSVIIQDGVTNIGDFAFYGCTGLTSVTIPDSVTSIGDYAFSGCTGLTSVTIGNSVTSIGGSAFYGCTGLTSVSIGNSLTSIGYQTFSGCTGLTSVTIPDSVTSIGYYAFRGCTGLTSVTIPDSVTGIGGYAFFGCTGLTSLSIPGSVTSMGEDVLTGCTNADLVISCEADSVGERYAKAEAIPVAVYEGIDGGSAYRLTAYPENKTNVIIPDTFAGKPVTALDSWLFAYNKSIKSVSIPDSVTEIPKGAFYNCVELKTVTMGSGVKAIGANAFEKCLYLENITLGNQLETIGDEAFYDCRRLKSLAIPRTVTAIGEEAFTNCRSLTSLNIPKGVGSLGSSESVGYGVFENCLNLSRVVLPANLSYINDNTFAGCRDLTVIGSDGSCARQYADSNGLSFVCIDGETVGDTDRDNVLGVKDISKIQRCLAGFEGFTIEQQYAADANGDGAVDINDVTQLQKHLAEYDVVLG